MPAVRGRLKQDQFANVAHIQCVESAINTLTYKKLETGISLFEKVAWVIHRVIYDLSGLGAAANGDGIRIGIATSDNPSAMTFGEAAFVDIIKLLRTDFGTAASAVILRQLWENDYTSLPGGGLIVPPNPVYLAVEGIGQPGVMTVDVRIFYTAKVLKAEEYWELVEARRIISST